MFNKRSRYYKLDKLAIRRSDGLTINGKQLRVQPKTEGKVFYQIESGDRIDHLAYKFLRQSKLWWHICDANPAFFSPKELLGTSPIKHLRVVVSFQGYQPEWVALFSSLHRKIGVQQILHGENGQTKVHRQLTYSVMSSFATIPDTDEVLFDPDTDEVLFDQAVRMQTISPALDTFLSPGGITLGGAIRVTKDGDNLWYVDDLENQIVYAYVLTLNDDPVPDEVSLFEATVFHTWMVEIIYNENSIASEELLDDIQSAGFNVDNHEFIGRVGKKIAIPAKYFG